MPVVHTFKETAESYIAYGGEMKYLIPIIEKIGHRPIAEVTPMEIRNLAMELKPNGSGATKNRTVVTPCRAVMYHGHDLGWRMQARVKLFPAIKTKKTVPANRRWLETFIDQCDADNLPHLAALVLFMNLTGSRISESVRLCGRSLDLSKKTAILERTKTEFNSVRYLPDHLVERIRLLEAKTDEPVFKYNCRYSVNERIKAVCARAKLEYKSSHVVGRHSFATNALNLGVGVRIAMDAGGWKSSKIFLETYAHSLDAGRTVADIFNNSHRKDQL